MKIGIYFCNCGSMVAGRIDAAQVAEAVQELDGVAYVATVDFICSETGKEFLRQDLQERSPDRVVMAACSPRDQESNLMRVVAEAGINPYLMQMVNIRELVAWVVADGETATAKAIAGIRGAVARVKLHQPLQKQQLEASADVLVVGAGPAGMKAALALAEAGRRVTLIEKTPAIGGLPVRFEELFPSMECAPCMLEPLMAEILHGPHAGNIELLTMTELTDAAGFYGNFIVTLSQRPRYVDGGRCIGCGECIEACPATGRNPFDCGLSSRKAMDFPFTGSLPNVPYLDAATCFRNKGEECSACQTACPIGDDVIRFDDGGLIMERKVGGIILATGGALLDCSTIPNLGYGALPDVHTALEFERLLAANGPTGGEIRTGKGEPPRSVAIIHCVGSRDEDYRRYCSGVCCSYAFKFTHLLQSRLPEAKVYHFHRDLALPGREGQVLYRRALENANAVMIPYARIGDLVILAAADGVKWISNSIATAGPIGADMVILCPAMIPGAGAADLGELLDVSLDPDGYFSELHGRLDAAQSKIKGIYLAGACHAPMDIQQATLQGMAAAGHVLSALAADKKLELDAVTAAVDSERCAGCRVCGTVCPYKAIHFDEETGRSEVTRVLCHGCGACVAPGPAAAITGHHFTTEQLIAEIRGVLDES